MPPTFGNGKICYIEIPATDVNQSANFYRAVFGWAIRHRGDGSIAFDDGVGEVSGTWVVGRPPSSTPGLMISIMVNSVASTLKLITERGGEIVEPIGKHPGLITSSFRDPAGNVLALYQH
jgi:predicted enzyme related to lactoylglutathione lyase